MTYLKNSIAQTLLTFFISSFAQFVSAQAPDVTFPKASSGFSPQVTYEAKFDDIWPKVIAALSENGFQIASASKDAMQISTGFKTGPALRETQITGALLSQYKYVVSVISVSPTQTRISINPTVEFRRNQSSFLIFRARGDIMWHDSTKDNPELVADLKNWLYEQIERSM